MPCRSADIPLARARDAITRDAPVRDFATRVMAHDGEVHALRAENAALRAELAALLASSGGTSPSDADAWRHQATTGAAPARDLPAHLRTWESVAAGESLTGADLERYARQVALPSFGAAKQAMLADARALVVGVGGLGSPAALYLAGAGVGRLALADADVVELSNLHRQIIHAESRRGAPKAVSGAAAVRALNARCRVSVHLEGVTPNNALDLVRDADVVLDCTDNVATRYLLSDACAVLGVPLVSAAAVSLEGQLSVFCRPRCAWLLDDDASRSRRSPRDDSSPHPPCYRCVFPKPPAAGDCTSCARGGVLGPVPGVMGTMQALEAIKVMTGLGDVSAGRLLTYDAASASRPFASVRLRAKNPDCDACGTNPKVTAETLAGYDYEAFVAGAAACSRPKPSNAPAASAVSAARTQSPSETPPELDDAAAAYLRNVRNALGDGAAPWGVDDDARATRRSPSANETETETRADAPASSPPTLDCKAKPPLPARAEAPHRVAPASLHAALKANASMSTGEPYVLVVDVRPRHLSDAASLRGAMRVPLAELEARVGEVRAASDAMRDAAERDARNRSLDGGGPGPGAVYAVCSRGNDSQLAERYLRAVGLPVVGDVVGGLERWREDVDPSFPKLV